MYEFDALKGLPVFFKPDGNPAFTRFPNFLVDKMMSYRGIPASFWKLTFVMWRHIMAPSSKAENGVDWIYDYTFKTTASQMAKKFGVGSVAYIDWTLAYKLSGLFDITYGQRYAKDVSGSPTVWRYKKTATPLEWSAFIIGLSDGLNEIHKAHIKNVGSQFGGWAICLALSIDAVREEAKLPKANSDFIQQAIDKGLAERKDGVVHYKFIKRGSRF